jgi:hypothetical protein
MRVQQTTKVAGPLHAHQPCTPNTIRMDRACCLTPTPLDSTCGDPGARALTSSSASTLSVGMYTSFISLSLSRVDPEPASRHAVMHGWAGEGAAACS